MQMDDRKLGLLSQDVSADTSTPEGLIAERACIDPK